MSVALRPTVKAGQPGDWVLCEVGAGGEWDRTGITRVCGGLRLELA